MSEWLASHGCTHGAMEATGVYWKPVWHVLEGSYTLVLATPCMSVTYPGGRAT